MGRSRGLPAQVLARDLLDRRFDRQAFKRAPDLQRLLHVLRRKLRDEGPAPRLDLYQALCRELLHGVPHRSEADAQLLGELFNVQALAGRDGRIQDRLPQRLVDGINQSITLKFGYLHGDVPLHTIADREVGVNLNISDFMIQLGFRGA